MFVEKAHGQGNQAAAKFQGPETADAAESREGARESRPMGEQSGAAAPEIGPGEKTRSEEVEEMKVSRPLFSSGRCTELGALTGRFRPVRTPI